MLRSPSVHLVPVIEHEDTPPLDPKQPYVRAVESIAGRVEGVHSLFDKFGRVRTLDADSVEGLFDGTWTGTAESHARAYMESDEGIKALGLQTSEWFDPSVKAIPGGVRVHFRQKLTVEGEEHLVRNGYVTVFIDSSNAVYRVNASVRRGRKPTSVDNVIGEEAALQACFDYLGVTSCVQSSVQLVMSSHNDQFDPCYEVDITTHEPRRVAQFLVKARSGEVLDIGNKLRAGRKLLDRSSGDLLEDPVTVASGGRRPRKPRPRTNVPPTQPTTPATNGRVFLTIPDPNKPLPQQVHDVVMRNLPAGAQVLENSEVVIYMGSGKKKVRAKSDGTFNYKPGDPEFSGVVTFFAYVYQSELMKKWGMVPQTQQMPIWVDDPTVRDNAYFDPMGYEIHLGIGSGLAAGGLNRNISYDFGVTLHENGHHIVYLQAPGNDLPGDEGGAIHESTGDVVGQLLVEWMMRAEFGTELKHTLTVADIEADARIIGRYALPPNGIRIQKNKASTPRDKTGEVHDDGLISGGATADLLVALVKAAPDIKTGLEQFGRISIMALALVPAHKVTFVDLLNAYIAADQKIYNGANKAAIVKAFGDHGIKLKSKGRSPIIIVLS